MSKNNSKWTVLSTSPTFGRYSRAPIDFLEEAGAAVVLIEAGDSERLGAELTQADAWITGYDQVNAVTLSTAQRLKVVAKAGAGMDNFDLTYLRDQGIAVVSVPGGNSEAVAEYAMAQILALARGIVANDKAVRLAAWKPNVGMSLRGRTLGIIGFGAIGRHLAFFGAAFGMTILTSDPVISKDQAAGGGAELIPLMDLLRLSDVVSIHVPLNDSTRGFFGASQFAMMQAHAYLVNASRGGLVDESALAIALQTGSIAGAAFDVFDREPMAEDNPLLLTPNLLLSPHTAGYSDTALASVTLSCAEGIIRALKSSDL